MKLNLGDALEWVAGAFAVVTAADATGQSWPAWLVATLFLGYQAQCFGGHSIALGPKLTAIRAVYRRLMEREDTKRATREQ